MNRNKALRWTFRMIIMMLILPATGLCAEGKEAPFPQYGTGPIQVRLYTDYFCPPCRAMEPSVEPILFDLLKRKVITLTLVDLPLSRVSALYAKYFLYALKVKNDRDHAFHVRNVLIAATSDRQMTTEARIAELFKSKGIPHTVFEAGPALERYNALIREDKVQATPTCVIIRDGKKGTFLGGTDIIAALKSLQ
jgi:thiol:disulfide interchange protein DsbA